MDRHLFRGRRIDNGKLITGGVIFDSGLEIDFSRNPISKDFKNCYIAENCDDIYEVDPATVEAVAVTPIENSLTQSYQCPNCEIGITCENYCYNCGQRIGWQ